MGIQDEDPPALGEGLSRLTLTLSPEAEALGCTTPVAAGPATSVSSTYNLESLACVSLRYQVAAFKHTLGDLTSGASSLAAAASPTVTAAIPSVIAVCFWVASSRAAASAASAAAIAAIPAATAAFLSAAFLAETASVDSLALVAMAVCFWANAS